MEDFEDKQEDAAYLKAGLMFSEEAEMACLGSMCVSAEAVPAVMRIIDNPQAFMIECHQFAFRAVVAVWSGGMPVDLVVVDEYLRAKGQSEIVSTDYLVRLAEAVPDPCNAEYYARIVQSFFRRRILLQFSIAMRADAHNLDLKIDDALGNVSGWLDKLVGKPQKPTEIKEILQSITDEGAEASDRRIITGFKSFDELTLGLGRGELTIIAGRPGHGKTTLALNLAISLALQKLSVAFYTLEMTPRSLSLKATAIITNRDSRLVFDNDEFRRESITAALLCLQESPLWFVDEFRTSRAIAAESMRLRHSAQLDLVVVDYLQLLIDARGGIRQKRHQAMGDACERLKRLAVEQSVAVVLCCQVNRGIEARDAKRHNLADLRDSGEIEASADVVAFVRRPFKDSHNEADRNVLSVDVAKQRLGPEGRFSLNFDPTSGAIFDAAGSVPF